MSVQQWWTQRGCTTRPTGPTGCDRASDFYGIRNNVSWGTAPLDAKNFWMANHCETNPVRDDTCQIISDVYGTYVNCLRD